MPIVSSIEPAIEHPADLVHIVSHGPHCLDGVTAAVAVARFHAGTEVQARFANNPEVNEVILSVPAPPPGKVHHLWITDISWTKPEADRHLRALAAAGTRIFWVDHHRTAIERLRRGAIDVPLNELVVEDTYAASRLVFEHLRARLVESGPAAPEFLALERLVMLADDNDRWIHALAGSRKLALVVGAMRENDAYRELLTIDAGVTYTPVMREAEARLDAELAATHALAERTRCERMVGDVRVVAAWCAGYPSEVGDAWGRHASRLVMALYDTKNDGVSFRRSPDGPIDLSRLAERFGGGGHAAAAGCKIEGLGRQDAGALCELVAAAVAGVLRGG